jgi:hypothetical protein
MAVALPWNPGRDQRFGKVPAGRDP